MSFSWHVFTHSVVSSFYQRFNRRLVSLWRPPTTSLNHSDTRQIGAKKRPIKRPTRPLYEKTCYPPLNKPCRVPYD